ncbi:tyrosine-type recombinase/integrase [Chloroflexota bacterium]
MKQRATALTNSQLLDQLCDLLIPKLEERLATHMPSKQRAVGSNPARDATKLARATAFPSKGKNHHSRHNPPHNARNVALCRSQPSRVGVSCKSEENIVTKLSDALAAYKICARAEGKSPRTIGWVTSSVGYFAKFLGGDPDISSITADDFRRFIIALQESRKFRDHPYNKPQEQKLSAQSIETYCRAIRAFFGHLHREELIEANPVARVKMPRVPKKVVPTLSEREVEKLLVSPDRKTDTGFRDYALMLTYLDTGARLSELAELKVEDVDFDKLLKPE